MILNSVIAGKLLHSLVPLHENGTGVAYVRNVTMKRRISHNNHDERAIPFAFRDEGNHGGRAARLPIRNDLLVAPNDRSLKKINEINTK
jgi:hypothetical protein